MRDGWTETTLGEVAEVVGGGTPKTKEPSYWGGDVLWVTPSEVTAQEGQIITSTERTITEDGLANSSAKLLPARAVLLTSRATIGATAITGAPMATNQGFASLIAKEGVLAEYLMYWCQAHTDEFVSRASGNTFLEISKTNVKSIPLLMPPLAEQQRIVDLISAVDSARESSERVASQTKQLLCAAASRFIADDSEWERRSVADVSIFAGGYAFPDRFQGGQTGEVPFYKVSDMNAPGNETRMTKAQNYVTEEVLGKLKAKAWPEGTVIFPKVGAALLTEKRRLLSVPSAFDNNVMGLVADESVVLPAYLFAFMETVRLGEFAQQGAVPSINQSHIRSLQIPVPPMEVQHEVVSLIGALREQSKQARCAGERLTELRVALLDELLSGNHEIPESYDELVGLAS